MIVADLEKELVQIPQHGKAGCVFKSRVIDHIAQRALLNGVLLQLELVVEINPEIAHENIESQLRFGRDQQVIGIVVRVIKVK